MALLGMGWVKGKCMFFTGGLLVQKRPEFFNFRRLTSKSQTGVFFFFLDLSRLSTLGRPLKIAAAVFFLFYITTGLSGGPGKKVK